MPVATLAQLSTWMQCFVSMCAWEEGGEGTTQVVLWSYKPLALMSATVYFILLCKGILWVVLTYHIFVVIAYEDYHFSQTGNRNKKIIGVTERGISITF